MYVLPPADMAFLDSQVEALVGDVLHLPLAAYAYLLKCKYSRDEVAYSRFNVHFIFQKTVCQMKKKRLLMKVIRPLLLEQTAVPWRFITSID